MWQRMKDFVADLTVQKIALLHFLGNEKLLLVRLRSIGVVEPRSPKWDTSFAGGHCAI